MAKRVLVVDDSPTIRKIVEVCLNGAGVGFEGASGGAEAAASLSARLPDLVLADVVMPAPDGYELCELVKRKTYGKRIPVVLMADPFQPFDAEKAMAAGADGNIAKPFDARTLMDMISDQLGSKFKRRAAGGTGGGARRGAVGLEEGTSPDSAEAGRALPAGLEGGRPGMSPAELDAVARRVVRMLSERVVRDIAWEVVPELSDLLIRERLQNR